MMAKRNTVAGGRERLLDAAEGLFADKGYDGASMRAITRAAGVELGLANYHFGTKAELFRQVLARRAPAMAAGLEGALVAARAEGTLDAVFAGFARSHLARLHDGEEGWRNYIRLAAHTALRGRREELTSAALIVYEPVLAHYRDAIAGQRAGTPREEIDRAFYVFHMAVLSILIDAPACSDEVEALIATMVRIFARGI